MELNFAFCEWELYDGTAPEEKAKNAKNGLTSMVKPFLKSFSQQYMLSTPFSKGGIKDIHFINSACFSPLYRQPKMHL